MTNPKTLLILLSFLFGACANTGGHQYKRAYEPGETYRYKMVRTYLENGKFKREEIAVSEHTVPTEGPPRERIRFTKLTKRTDTGTEDLSSKIVAFPPYEASTAQADDPTGLALPDISGWDMGVVGPITDLHTFLVSVSPQAGANKISQPGETWTLPGGHKASWANGENIPVGEDCIQISITLLEINENSVVYETRFMPPKEACLEPLAPWMEAPVVKGRPNNFQQKMNMGPMAFVMWGREEFTVRTTVRRSDGRILSATMDNRLTLRLKLACDPELKACKQELPLKIQRNLTLTLLP